MIFLPFSVLFIVLLILLLPFLFFVVQVEIVRMALGKLGLSPNLAFLIIFFSLLGSMVNIPVYTREATMVYPERNPYSFFGFPFTGFQGGTRQVIAVNLGGCIIPLLLCAYLIPRSPLLPVFFATVITTLVSFRLSRIIPGAGIRIPALVPPLLAVFLAYAFSPGNKTPVAYISGVLGVLIGADLLNLPRVGSYPGMISIGGAGVVDGIFLVGIISALLA